MRSRPCGVAPGLGSTAAVGSLPTEIKGSTVDESAPSTSRRLSPAVKPVGTVRSIWYPASPGARPENNTVAAVPPNLQSRLDESGKEKFFEKWAAERAEKAELKGIYELNLDARASHRLKER